MQNIFKKIAYLIVFLIFIIIAFILISIDRNITREVELESSVEIIQPNYTEATPEVIFREELGI